MAIRTRTLSALAAATFAAAALAAAPAAQAATSAPAGQNATAQEATAQATAAGCYTKRNYTGGRWLSVHFCAGRVTGYSGFVEDSIWLDRARSSNPTSWTPRLGLYRDSYYTDDVANPGGYYWRTCVVDSGRYYCTAWHR
ncbi:hypothetical protein [Jiangella anatolica]|uniref:Uncharacterized protein n=1 Tax=Jiangella anatolica TaxID=2670374 RepID=A0A2W2BUZ6_9ACTN|nr:hypothetical protein [Jiangella anatolica]PZF84214.1 hypothetical protein C1I92_09205 [Jiangella anatolica]